MYRQMVENATVRMIVADRNLDIIYMNPASVEALRRLQHLLPCPVDAIVGQSIDISDVWSDCLRDSAALFEMASIDPMSCSTAAVISSTLAACDWAPSLSCEELSAIILAPSPCCPAASITWRMMERRSSNIRRALAVVEAVN